MKKARTLKDVLDKMLSHGYSFIGERYDRNLKRCVLTFENGFGYKDNGINKQYLIGDNFKVISYNNGHYYEIHKI